MSKLSLTARAVATLLVAGAPLPTQAQAAGDFTGGGYLDVSGCPELAGSDSNDIWMAHIRYRPANFAANGPDTHLVFILQTGAQSLSVSGRLTQDPVAASGHTITAIHEAQDGTQLIQLFADSTIRLPPATVQVDLHGLIQNYYGIPGCSVSFRALVRL